MKQGNNVNWMQLVRPHLANLQDGVVLVDGVLPHGGLDGGAGLVAQLDGAHAALPLGVAERADGALGAELGLDGPVALVRVQRSDGLRLLARGVAAHDANCTQRRENPGERIRLHLLKG